jgi:photosystem II stability/assembly factor-like uncharacterized protein
MMRSLPALVLGLSVLPLPAQKGPGKGKAVDTPAPPATLKLDPLHLKAFKARAIGPATMGGRISDLAFDPKDPWTWYAATAHGGLMKTADDGGSFTSLTDKAGLGSCGAVAVAPSDPRTLWLGTGEANDRNSSGWGKGVFVTRDGGTSWESAGLKNSRAIARIAVHPTEPGTAYVAAMGHLWAWGGERGLYKTTDGGKTWKAVLAGPAGFEGRLGCGDVVLDPKNPAVVYAALYARRRTPWSFEWGPDATEGRDLGGIFRSADGGATWTRLSQGLPAQTGRIGLAVSASKPGVVMAIVQSAEGGAAPLREPNSKAGGVFRSEDGGATWTRTSPLNPRPFYFSQLRIDPADDQRVYVLAFGLHVSADGGRSFREDLSEKVHPDLHALAFDPRDSRRQILGTDGGLYGSVTSGRTWRHLNTVALGEFYRISVDDATPYRIGGGLQDNRNWLAPSRTDSKDGLLNQDWVNLSGGDGFHVVFDPVDPDLVYAESQGGAIFRLHLKSGAVKGLRPDPGEGQPAYRFHWASPFLASRHEPGTLFLAGNRVFKFTEKGERWSVLSPDLTVNEPARSRSAGSGAETYGTIYALSESPRKAGVLWAGTDDGKVWTTSDGGAAWTDLTGSLPFAARNAWIQRLDASPSDASAATLVVQTFRGGGDAPLGYRTADGGRSWRLLTAGLPQDEPLHVLKEDPRNPRLYYAGTEGGLYVSTDEGGSWTKFGELPPVPVDDLVVQPRERDLVVATHGRSCFVVDDVAALQEATPEVLAKDLHLFPIRPAKARNLLAGSEAEDGKTGTFRGANPPEGAILTFHLKAWTGEEPAVAITDAAGQPAANLKNVSARPGFNRVVWDLKPSADLVNSYGGGAVKFVRPGEYTVTLSLGKAKSVQKVTVTAGELIETR